MRDNSRIIFFFPEALPESLREATGRTKRVLGGGWRGVGVQGLPVAQVQVGRWRKAEGEQGTLVGRRDGTEEQRRKINASYRLRSLSYLFGCLQSSQ